MLVGLGTRNLIMLLITYKSPISPIGLQFMNPKLRRICCLVTSLRSLTSRSTWKMIGQTWDLTSGFFVAHTLLQWLLQFECQANLWEFILQERPSYSRIRKKLHSLTSMWCWELTIFGSFDAWFTFWRFSEFHHWERPFWCRSCL